MRPYALPSRLVAALILTALASAQDVCVTWRMSTDATGTAGNGWCRKPSLSADGDWIAFESGSSDLVPGDTNGFCDIFVRQVSTNLIERVSVSSSGAQADADCVHASISGSGRYVSFESEASTLAGGDTAGFRDVFVHDRQTNTTTLVSVAFTGAFANGPSGAGGLWRGSDISGDGNLVVFQSFASTLVAGDTNMVTDIFIRNLSASTTTRVNVSGAVQANSSSQDPVISDDGMFVAYRTSANNLVPGDTQASDIYRVRLSNLQQERISLSTTGDQPDGSCGQPDISENGDFIVYESFATTLVPGDTNGQSDVFLRDVLASTTERISLTWNGQQVPSWSKSPSISYDGSRVAFTSNSSALIPSGSSIQSVYLRDRNAATTERWGESSTGAIGFASSDTVSISPDGSFMAFASLAVLEPNDANNMNDIYLRRCGPTAELFCEGLADTCPCGNAGAGGAGCENSATTGGALLDATGLPSVQADSVVLTASGLPGGEPILFFQGTLAIAGGSGLQLGDGLRCVGGAVFRLGVKTSSPAGVASYGNAPDVPLSIRGGVPALGQTLLYQGWYRDPDPFCTPDGFNLTHGVRVVWAP